MFVSNAHSNLVSESKRCRVHKSTKTPHRDYYRIVDIMTSVLVTCRHALISLAIPVALQYVLALRRTRNGVLFIRTGESILSLSLTFVRCMFMNDALFSGWCSAVQGVRLGQAAGVELLRSIELSDSLRHARLYVSIYVSHCHVDHPVDRMARSSVCFSIVSLIERRDQSSCRERTCFSRNQTRRARRSDAIVIPTCHVDVHFTLRAAGCRLQSVSITV